MNTTHEIDMNGESNSAPAVVILNLPNKNKVKIEFSLQDASESLTVKCTDMSSGHTCEFTPLTSQASEAALTEPMPLIAEKLKWQLMFSGPASAPLFSIRSGATFKEALSGELICSFPKTTSQTASRVSSYAKMIVRSPDLLEGLEDATSMIYSILLRQGKHMSSKELLVRNKRAKEFSELTIAIRGK